MSFAFAFYRKLTLGCALLAATLPPLLAQDASIDRLLSKLPPPEKLVKPTVARSVAGVDAASRDPLIKDIVEAARVKNAKRATVLSRQLTERHPRSAGAWYLRGVVALATAQRAEAASSFRTGSSSSRSFPPRISRSLKTKAPKDVSRPRFRICCVMSNSNRRKRSAGLL